MVTKESKRLSRCADLCVGKGYRFALGLVGRREDAEDLVQEAFLIACQKVKELPRSPWPWIAKVIVNLARNHWRKTQVRGEHAPIAEQSAPTEPGPNPLESSLRAELHADMRRAYAALPSGQREVLSLLFLAGLTLREAAKVRGQAHSSLRRERDQALESLSKQLDLPSKESRYAIPIVFSALPPSAGFATRFGLSSVPLGAGIATTLLGGIAMKKIAAIIILLAMLLTGGGLIAFNP